MNLPIWTGHNSYEVLHAAEEYARETLESGQLLSLPMAYGEGLRFLRGGNLVAVKLGDAVYVTTKPHSTSLRNDGGLWRTGPYAGCHVRRFGSNGEVDYFSLTVYRNGNHPYHRNTKREHHSEIHHLARLLREHACKRWYH